MWASGDIKIKIKDDSPFNFDERLYFSPFYGSFKEGKFIPNDYFRIGKLLITEKTLSANTIKSGILDNGEFLNKSIKLILGNPYQSAESEVLKVSINYSDLEVYSGEEHDDKALNKIEEIFDLSSFRIDSLTNSKYVIDETSKKLFYKQVILGLLHFTMFSHRVLYKEEFLSKYYDQTVPPPIAHIAKFIPLKLDRLRDKDSYKDVIFHDVIYQGCMSHEKNEAKCPLTVKGVLTVMPDFYSKYMIQYRANSGFDKCLVMFMDRGSFNMFENYQLLSMFITPSDRDRMLNNMIFHALLGLAAVHIRGVTHADYHVGNVVYFYRSGHNLYKENPVAYEFNTNLPNNLIEDGGAYRAIDFGRSFYFEDINSATKLLEFYNDHLNITPAAIKKAKKNKAEFALMMTLLDVFSIVMSAEESLEYYKEKDLYFKDCTAHKEKLKSIKDDCVSSINTFINGGNLEGFIRGLNILGGDKVFDEESKIFQNDWHTAYQVVSENTIPRDITNIQYAGSYSRLPVYHIIKAHFPEAIK